MKLTDLKKKGFKIVTNWQECNKKSIFLFDNNDYPKFIKYKKLAIKKNVNLLSAILNLRGILKKIQSIFSFTKIKKI